MYLNDLRRHKRIIGSIVLIFGILLMIAAIITAKILVPQIKEIGINSFLEHRGVFKNTLFTLFSAGFPVGAGITVVGAAILSDACRKRIWWYAWLIILAAVIISTIPLIFGKEHSSLYFMMGGILITILFLLFTWFWSRNRHKLDDKSQIAADLKMAGYLFFLLASWEICGLGGIPFYILYPEKVIQFNSLPLAIAHTKLIMALFITAWIFTFIGYNYNNRVNISLRKKIKKLQMSDDQ